MQSILDDPAIADKLATTVEPITQAEYTARMNTDPTSFFSTMFRYATNDTSIIPIELTTGGKVGVSDVQIKNYVESHMPANATEATLPGILFNITGQELTYSSMFKLLGHDNNPTYKTFEDSSS
jgi:hypothetical protein